jgi:tetratricopeptide (TPR) repeat protein
MIEQKRDLGNVVASLCPKSLRNTCVLSIAVLMLLFLTSHQANALSNIQQEAEFRRQLFEVSSKLDPNWNFELLEQANKIFLKVGDLEHANRLQAIIERKKPFDYCRNALRELGFIDENQLRDATAFRKAARKIPHEFLHMRGSFSVELLGWLRHCSIVKGDDHLRFEVTRALGTNSSVVFFFLDQAEQAASLKDFSKVRDSLMNALERGDQCCIDSVIKIATKISTSIRANFPLKTLARQTKRIQDKQKRIQTLQTLSETASNLADKTLAAELRDESATHLHSLQNDKPQKEFLLLKQAELEWLAGKNRKAIQILEQTLRFIRNNTDIELRAFAFAHLGDLALKYGDKNQAIRWSNNAIELAKASKPPRKHLWHTAYEILNTLPRLEDSVRAKNYIETLRQLALEMPSPYDAAPMLGQLAQAAERSGARDLAKKLFNDAQQSMVKIDNASRKAELLLEWKPLGSTLYGREYGDEMFKRARQAAESSLGRRSRTYSLTYLAATAFEEYKTQQGVEMFELASRLAFFDQLRGLRAVAVELKDNQLTRKLLFKIRENIDASDRIDSAKNDEYRELAVDFAKRGLYQDTQETLARITRNDDKTKALIGILSLDQNVH